MDDKTAVSISNPEKKKDSFSFFGASGVSNTGKLKYMANTVDESAVEDTSFFVNEKTAQGIKPTVLTKKKDNSILVRIIPAVAAALFVAAVILVLTYHSPERLSRLLSLGDKYLSELAFENAAHAYKSALKIDSRNEHAYIGLTKSYIGLGDYDKALETVEKAISLLGNTDELVELRRRVFVEKAGETGLYLDDGTFVSDGSSLTLTDLRNAFLYYGPDVPVTFSGSLHDGSDVQFTDEDISVSIREDTISSFDGNIYAARLIRDMVQHGGNDCWLYLHTTRNSADSTRDENRYHITFTDAELEAAIQDLGIDKEAKSIVAENVPDEDLSDEAESLDLQKVCNLTEAGYEGLGNAYGGVMIVMNNGLYGAVDYDMNELVPCKYKNFRPPNNKGYFIMLDENNAYLFSPQGELIHTTSGLMITTGNCFIVADSDYGPYEEFGYNGTLTYYDYSGKEILKTSVTEDTPVYPVGSHDGVVLVRRYTEDANTGHMIAEIGELSEAGTVTWKTEYHDDSAATWEEEENTTTYTDSGWELEGNAGSAYMFIPRILLSGLNGGYYVTYSPYVDALIMTMYDKDGNFVSEFDLGTIDPNGNISDYDETNWLFGYYYDGAINYNRGTKMVCTSGGRSTLVDLLNHSTLANYENISMAEDDLWLVGEGGRFGYIDPDGNEVAMYDDASAFHGGYATIIKDGRAYLIDTDLNMLEDLGEADRVTTYGEIFAVSKNDSTTLYRVK